MEGLRSTEVVFNEADRDELLATADGSLDPLSRLVENLLDMSRLQAGALGVHLEATSVAELAPLAVDQVGGAGLTVPIILDDQLQDAQADPTLLERILVNLVFNAVKHSPADSAPTIAAESDGDYVHVRVIYHGKGLSADDRERVFLPFQRTGDTNGEPGIGLGLALSRGLAEAMGETLDAHDTPGGGLTMSLALPVAPTSVRGASSTSMVDQP